MKYALSLLRKIWILVLVLSVAEITHGQTILDLLLQAKALNRAGNTEQSIQLLTEALSSTGDYRLLLERAEANILNGDHSAAVADYNAANNILEHSGEFGLAKVYAIKGDAATSVYHLELVMKSAFRKSEKEIMLDPAFGRIENRPEWRQFWKKNWYSLQEEKLSEIEYYASTGNIENASALLNDLTRTYPGSEKTLYATSLVDLSAGRYTSAVRILSGLLSADPGNEKYLRSLARAQEALGNPAGASLTYTKLLDLYVADASLLLLRAECFRKTGETEKALADAGRYLAYYPQDKYALSLAGRLSATNGDNIKALRYFTENLRNNPNDPQCYIDRANAYLSARSWEWAVKDYSMALDLDPGNSDTWLNKGIALINLGNTGDACFDFKKSFSMGNKRATDYISKHCIK